MSSSLTVLAAGHLDVLARSDPAPAGAVPSGLLEALAQVPGPRDPRGVRYDLVPVLAVGVCATLAGAPSYAAIAEWAGDVGDGHIPLLLAISDNGPQMRSVSTREFPADVAIARQFWSGRSPDLVAGVGK